MGSRGFLFYLGKGFDTGRRTLNIDEKKLGGAILWFGGKLASRVNNRAISSTFRPRPAARRSNGIHWCENCFVNSV